MTLTAMRPDFGRSNRRENVAVERRPCFRVDFRLQRRPERLVRVVHAQEVRLPDEEALVVVVRVDEPAGDAVGPVAPDFAGARMEHVHTMALHPDPPGFGILAVRRQDLDVRLAEDDVPVLARSTAMCRSAFMRALSTGSAPSLSNSVASGSSDDVFASVRRGGSGNVVVDHTNTCGRIACGWHGHVAPTGGIS